MVQTLLLTIALVGAAGLLSTAIGSRWPMALLMVVLLGRGVLALDWRSEIIRPYQAIRPRHVALGLLMLGLIGTLLMINMVVDHPILSWSILHIVGQEGGNITTVGFQFGPLFALPYLALLLAALPTLALIEESWFRRGTRGWLDGLWRSLLFGLAHLVVGVPLGIALFGLTSIGLVFTAVYLRHARRPPAAGAVSVFPAYRVAGATPDERRGMEASAVQHLAYNLILLLVASIALILHEIGVIE